MQIEVQEIRSKLIDSMRDEILIYMGIYQVV